MAMYPSKKKPSGNVDLGTFTTNGQVTGKAVSGKATASFTINVPHPTHTTTYTPTANKSNNDMGATHSYRYVDTSGMIVPSGNKSITANGTGIDVSSYSTVSVSVPHPTHTTSFTPTANLKGAAGNANDMGTTHSYRYVDTSGMIVPSGNKSITANGTGIDVSSYSTVSVSVPHPTHTTTYTPAANKSNNDMGATHSYRYVDTTGMIVPSGTKDNSSSPYTSNGTYTVTGLDSYTGVKLAVSVPNPTLSGDADEGNVLANKTFYKNSYTKKTGTMTNNGAVSKTLSAGELSYTVPSGYHNGSGTVSVTKGVAKIGTTDKTWTNNGTVNLTAGQSLSIGAGVYYAGTINAPSNPTLSGDATAAYVYPGKTFYSNSYTKQTGTMATKAAATYNTSTSDQTISSGQYLTGAQTIKAVATSGISAANIKSGAVVKVGDANSATRIANVTGTFTSSSTVSSGQTAAGASQIKSGYSAWVNGSEVKGSYVEPTIISITPDSNYPQPELEANKNYKPTKAGYAISSFTNINVSGAGFTRNPQYVEEDSMNFITGSAGYVIDDYQVINPGASGSSFNSGMVRMGSGGYAYSSKPVMTRTQLWVNSATSASFGAQTITLNQSMINFKYLEVTFYAHATTSGLQVAKNLLIPVDEFVLTKSTSNSYKANLGIYQWSRYFARGMYFVSNTQFYIGGAYRLDDSGADNKCLIPVKVNGINVPE